MPEWITAKQREHKGYDEHDWPIEGDEFIVHRLTLGWFGIETIGAIITERPQVEGAEHEILYETTFCSGGEWASYHSLEEAKENCLRILSADIDNLKKIIAAYEEIARITPPRTIGGMMQSPHPEIVSRLAKDLAAINCTKKDMNNMLTDAVNKIINTKYLVDVKVKIEDNKLIITDEFGTMSNFFTDNDPDLHMKVARFWGDFLQHRTDKLRERMHSNNNIEIWYDVEADEPFFGGQRADTEEDVLKIVAEYRTKGYRGIRMFRMTKEAIPLELQSE